MSYMTPDNLGNWEDKPKPFVWANKHSDILTQILEPFVIILSCGRTDFGLLEESPAKLLIWKLIYLVSWGRPGLWKFKINEFEANFGWGISAKLPFDLNYGKPTLIQLMVQCHYLWHFADLYCHTVSLVCFVNSTCCTVLWDMSNLNLCTINTFETTMVEGLLELTYLFRQFWPKNIRIKPVYMWCICCVIYRGDNAIRK